MDITPRVEASGINGTVDMVPVVSKPVTHLERFWAYLTIKQTLEDKELAVDKEPYERKAIDLAMKYSFVTPVSSLVVVKPHGVEAVVDPVPADTGKHL